MQLAMSCALMTAATAAGAVRVVSARCPTQLTKQYRALRVCMGIPPYLSRR